VKRTARLAFAVALVALAACSSSPEFRGTIFVADTDSKEVAVVDGATMKLVARIPLPGKPHGVDIEPGSKRLWASNIEGDTVSVIDIASRSVTTSIKVCKGPVNVAFSPGRAFAACGDGYMAVIDTATLAVLKTEAIGFGPHQIIAGPKDHIWAVNRGSNDLSEIDPAKGTLITRHPAGPFAYDAAFTPSGKYVFVTSKTWGAVSVLKTDDWQILGSIKVGGDPSSIAMSRDGKRAYVTNKKDGTVSVINALTFQVVRTITVQSEPGGIALSPDGRVLVVSNFASNTLSIIDTDSDEIIRTVSVGEAPDDVTLLPA